MEKENIFYKNSKIVIGVLITLIIFLLICFFYFRSRKTFTITFELQNGLNPIVEIVRKGKKITKPTNPTREGYTFIEWQLDGVAYDFDLTVENDITLKAIWKLESVNKVEHTIKFDTNGGDEIPEQKVEDGNLLLKPIEPTKKSTETTKYIFEEWQLNGSAYDFNMPVKSDMVLIASWKEESLIEKYTVTFNSNGGSSVSSQTVQSGNKIVKPTNPTREGYTFIEWQLNGKTYDFNNLVTSSITLTAKWIQNVVQKYTVTFNSNGGSSVSSQTVQSGNKVVKPTNPTREGYTFIEWQLNGKTYDFNNLVTSNITLIAKWTQNAVQNYTVTFNSNGGSLVNSQSIQSGNKVIKPTNPTREGYAFIEWQLNGKTYDFNNLVTSNITLTAKWTQKTYTMKAIAPDSYTTNRRLEVYENGTLITVYKIYYSDGTFICNGSAPNVDKSALDESAYLVQLSSGGEKFRTTLVQ